jgi:predicted transcriptional regulator|tara:strand:+ start:75 stop:317 length:243 start_codon:yes stop_codon:yes gene_type:complete
MYSMKTTLNIPDKRMKALLKATKAKTKTEAINTAIEDYIYQENVKKVMALAGTGGFMTREELSEMREMELNEAEPITPPK